MASISSHSITQHPIQNHRASRVRSVQYPQLQFGMHQQQAEDTNTGCFRACFNWIQNMFRRAPNQTTSAIINTPLLHRQSGSAHSVSPTPSDPVRQPNSRMDYDSFQSREHNLSLSASQPLSRQVSMDASRSMRSDSLPKPIRYLRSASGEKFIHALEEGNFEDTGTITLEDMQGNLLGTAELNGSVALGDKTFHRLQLEINNPTQPAFEQIDQASVLEQLLKSSVRQAKINGMALMVYPQDGDQEVLYRQHSFQPLADVLKAEPPAKYKSYLAVNFPRPSIPEYRRLTEEASGELVVGSPPGWKEERRALQRWWESRVTSSVKPDEK